MNGQRGEAHLAGVTLNAVLALGQEGQEGCGGELRSEGSECTKSASHMLNCL
jgi:hypothetical protein